MTNGIDEGSSRIASSSIWNPRWRDEGREPDYRFSLANERTFLAWIRTALALLAGGVVVDQFATKLQPQLVFIAIAVGLSVLSTVLCGMAYLRWRDNEISMRHGRALKSNLSLPLTAAVTLLLAAGIAVSMVMR